ncbi:MAG: DUF1292 domain-containing protein [Clostridia bacterium]|nr:DUF1292 domain-containing protein [Clostridia bacterium]
MSISEYNETVVLYDEEDCEIECELLDRIEYDGAEYCVLLPVDDDSSEPECIILRALESGDMVGIEDAETLDKLFAMFLERNGLR